MSKKIPFQISDAFATNSRNDIRLVIRNNSRGFELFLFPMVNLFSLNPENVGYTRDSYFH